MDYIVSDTEFECESQDSSDIEDSECPEEENCSTERGKKSCYRVLSFQDICKRQEEAMDSVSSLCCLSQAESRILLQHYKWNDTKLMDEWFVNEQKLRKDLGLFHKASAKRLRADERLYCSICMDIHCISDMKALFCAHYFCNECWAKYIEISIRENGIACLSLRCPEPKCGAAVGEDTVLSLITDEQDRRKYGQFLAESYVGGNRGIKWCPSPECEYAVELESGIAQLYDVTCKCSHNFCWNCSEEMHRPVDCDTVRKWVLKNRDNAETENWKIVNTKPCPQCGRSIEKNQGCMHMTCVHPCCFQFCWLCLRDWRLHSDSYACNRFQVDEQGTQIDKSETEEEKIMRKEREAIKKSLDRYGHYYERWIGHEKSRAKAVSDLKHAQNVQIKQLRDMQYLSPMDIEFVINAWVQIVECRRALKWTYAYGYYLSQDETFHKNLFEDSQAYAESWLERLHHCVEEELQPFIASQRPFDEFDEFRIRLVTLTKTTGHYFQNLVKALEKK